MLSYDFFIPCSLPRRSLIITSWLAEEFWPLDSSKVSFDILSKVSSRDGVDSVALFPSEVVAVDLSTR